MHLYKQKLRLSNFQWFIWLKTQLHVHAWCSGENRETCTSHYPFSPLHLSPLMSWNSATHYFNSFYTCSFLQQRKGHENDFIVLEPETWVVPYFLALKLGDDSLNLDWSQNAHETSYSLCFQTELRTVFHLRYSYRLIAKFSECLTVLSLFIFPVCLGKHLFAGNQTD